MGRLWIVPPIYIEFISPIKNVKYLLFHCKERTLNSPTNITTSWVFSFYQSQQGRQIINTHLGGLRKRGCWNNVLFYLTTLRVPHSWTFVEVRYIGRKFLLLVAMIRKMKGKLRGRSLQHLQCWLLNILSFQLLDFIKEIGTIHTYIQILFFLST